MFSTISENYFLSLSYDGRGLFLSLGLSANDFISFLKNLLQYVHKKRTGSY